jgi:hypothetical protein
LADVADVAGVPSAEELAALLYDELAARLAGAYRVIAGLAARVELLERRAGRDSPASPRPAVVGQPVSEAAAGPVAAGAGEAAAGHHAQAGR